MYLKYGSRIGLMMTLWSKYVAIFMIDNKVVLFWLNKLLEYISENTSEWLQLKYSQRIIRSYCF